LQLISTFGSKETREMHKQFGGRNEGKRAIKRSGENGKIILK
jgi:hypothetical protein